MQHVKYSRINLTKDAQDMYKDNFKTVLREIKEDLSK